MHCAAHLTIQNGEVFLSINSTHPMSANAFADLDPDAGAPPPPPSALFLNARTAPAFSLLESTRAPTGPIALRQNKSFSESLLAQSQAIATAIIPSAESLHVPAALTVTIKISSNAVQGNPIFDGNDITLFAVATAFASQPHFKQVYPIMRPENGLSFHFYKIKDYPEAGAFFKCAFVPHASALESIRAVNWNALLSTCPSFNFSCPSRDKVTRTFKEVQARIELIHAPQHAASSNHAPATNTIQCFVLFNPELLKSPLQQVADILHLSSIAPVKWSDLLSIPAPLKGKHVSAHTKQLLLRIPIPAKPEDGEQLMYNLLLASNKGLKINPAALASFCSSSEDSAALSATITSLALHVTLRLPMVNDFGARRALPIKLQDYFRFLLDSQEFKYDPKIKSRVDRRGLYHEGSSANTSAAESSEAEAPFIPDAKTMSEAKADAEAKAASDVKEADEAKAPAEANAAAEAIAAAELKALTEAKSAAEANTAAEAKAADEVKAAAEAKAAAVTKTVAELKAETEAKSAALAKVAAEVKAANEAKASAEAKAAAEVKATAELKAATEAKAAAESKDAAEAKAADEAKATAEAKAVAEAKVTAELKAAIEASTAAELKAAAEATAAKAKPTAVLEIVPPLSPNAPAFHMTNSAVLASSHVSAALTAAEALPGLLMESKTHSVSDNHSSRTPNAVAELTAFELMSSALNEIATETPAESPSVEALHTAALAAKGGSVRRSNVKVTAVSSASKQAPVKP
jgi:hypothetical protein